MFLILSATENARKPLAVHEHPSEFYIFRINSQFYSSASVSKPARTTIYIVTHLFSRTVFLFRTYYDHKLNSEQKQAVQKIVSGSARPAPYLVFGPPGTGKTVTLVEAIKQV